MTRFERGIVEQATEAVATVAGAGAGASIAQRGRFSEALVLAKPGIVRLVTITAGVGFALAALQQRVNSWTITEFALLVSATLVGTALSAAGANALNQAWESSRDSLMKRTSQRPIPTGKVTPAQGFIFGSVMSAVGVMILLIGAGPWSAAVSLATILLYVLVYTPMKSRSELSTWVGAVPGALPPIIGWAAASQWPHPGSSQWGGLDLAGGWTVFLIMFAWQIPHFLAIAWKYRDDYARAGYRVISVSDPSGSRTAWTSFWWTLIMIAVSLLPLWAFAPRVGAGYAVAALLGGLGMLWLAVRLVRERGDAAARALFFGSLAYLPLILIALVIDASLPPMNTGSL